MKLLFYIILIINLCYSTLLPQKKNNEVNYYHGNIRISTFQANLKSDCSASVKLYVNDSLINQIEYKSIESLGGYSGLFIDKDPVIANNFIITKHGDYDGRTILIKNNGKIEDLPGGIYFLSEDKNLLFSEHLQDCCDEFLIYDLKKEKVIFTSEFNNEGINHDVIRFFRMGKIIYVLTYNENVLNGIYRYDNNKNKLEKIKSTKINTKKLIKIRLLPDAVNMSQCECN